MPEGPIETHNAVVIVCPACDLVHRESSAPVPDYLECVRCHTLLQRPRAGTLDAAISAAVCATVFFVLSNAYPLVAMHINGTTRDTTLFGAARGLLAQEHYALSALVFVTTIVAPLLQISTAFYLLVPLRLKREAPGQRAVFRLLSQLRPWSFMEVFMLGALAALVRLAKFAQVVPGVAMWSCVLLMLSLSALNSVTTPEQFWSWVEKRRS